MRRAWHCDPPAGAFYAFPNVEKISKNSRTAAQILLDKAHIATIPGSVFGAQGRGAHEPIAHELIRWVADAIRYARVSLRKGLCCPKLSLVVSVTPIDP